MNIFSIFLSAVLPIVLAEQWIDPHDMNPKPKRNLKKSSSIGNIERSTEIPIQVNNVEETAADINNPSMYHSKISFSLDNESVQFLKDFSDSEKVSLDQLRKLDSIISDIFRRRYFDDISDFLTLSQDRLFNFLTKHGFVLIGSCVFIYISYNLFRHNFSLGYVFRYLVFTVIVVDYIQRYQYLSEEAEEHNMHVKYSSKCDTTKMNWGEYFKFMTGHVDCEKKVVSLLEVLLLQVRSVIIVPLAAVGAGMGQFGTELWENLPFPWNIIIFPIMLIFCLLVAALVMTSINGTPFKVNLMHMFHIEFGEKKNGIAHATLDKLLDVVGRPLVLDVNDRRGERVPVKEKNPPKALERKKSSPDKNNSNKNNDKSKQKPSRNGSKSSLNNSKIEEVEKTPERKGLIKKIKTPDLAVQKSSEKAEKTMQSTDITQ